MAEAQLDPSFPGGFRAGFLAHRRDALAALLARAEARGEWQARVARATLIYTAFGVMWYACSRWARGWTTPRAEAHAPDRAGRRRRSSRVSPLPARQPLPVGVRALRNVRALVLDRTGMCNGHEGTFATGTANRG